jgi:acyl-coenzyme A synthetase/AMP-(fatty) acid ligase
MNRLTPHLRVSYATSEVGVISIAQPDEHRQWPDGVGHPIPGVEVEVRDEHGVVVPRGERGNPWVRKAGAAHAGLEEVQGWLRIPDIVSWPDGAPLQFHGRADDLITMNTIGVFPAEIEDVLGAHPAVLHVAAYGVESNRHGQIPVAAVVLRRDVPAEESELLDYARRSLGLRSPRAVFFVDELPRNANGKVLVRALPRRH